MPAISRLRPTLTIREDLPFGVLSGAITRIRNVTLAGRRTSLRVDDVTWAALGEICAQEDLTLHDLVAMIAARRPEGTGISAAVRTFTLAYWRFRDRSLSIG